MGALARQASPGEQQVTRPALSLGMLKAEQRVFGAAPIAAIAVEPNDWRGWGKPGQLAQRDSGPCHPVAGTLAGCCPVSPSPHCQTRAGNSGETARCRYARDYRTQP